MNLKQSEQILDGAGKAITGKSTLSGKDWRTISGVVFIACVFMAGLIITAGWMGARDQLKSLKDMDIKNSGSLSDAKTEISHRLDVDEKKIRVLEDAVIESRINFKWIKDFMQKESPKKDPEPPPR